jgi:hypothetical protein
VCFEGECLGDCGELTNCGADCVDTESHPLHCGACGERCGVDQACLGGTCQFAEEPVDGSCDSCPCPGGCPEPEFDTCCYDDFLGTPLCVGVDAC